MKPPQTARGHVAIIGAGPAGLMAAERIATAGHAVTIYERMPSPARKFLIAGRGGLNLTHSEPLDAFVERYGENASIIRSAVTSYPPQQLVAWANGLGQETFIGSSSRIFPRAMKASPLLRAWLKRLEGLGVVLKTRHTFIGFASNDDAIFSLADGTSISNHHDAIVLALGGASWPRLGADGGWVEPLTTAGIAVTPLTPANSGVLISWSQILAARFAGQPLKRIAATIGTATQRGEAVITRSGLEGGVVYALGREIRAAVRNHGSAAITLDLKPDTTAAELTARLSRPRGTQPLTNFLRKAANLDPAAIGLLREAGQLPNEPSAVAVRIKAVPLTVTGMAGLDRAISTAGGVQLTELTPDFMVSARPGMFVAGEMLDWEAPTGGYLLQASVATGNAAAGGVLSWLDARMNGGPQPP